MTQTEVGGSLLVGFYTAHFLQWLKMRDWFPLMKEGFPKLNRAVGWAVAFLVAIGLHWTFNVDSSGWHMGLSGPQKTLSDFVLDVLRQYAVQKAAYATTVGDHPRGA